MNDLNVWWIKMNMKKDTDLLMVSIPPAKIYDSIVEARSHQL